MANDPNTSIVYPEIRVLDPSITTPDFVLFNGFLQQQGDGDVRFEGLELTLNVPELPKFTVEDGYYQIWGGTQSVIASANDFAFDFLKLCIFSTLFKQACPAVRTKSLFSLVLYSFWFPT